MIKNYKQNQKMIKSTKILGINFVNGEYQLVKSYLNNKNFMVVPSAPGLATIDLDIKYYKSIKNSDFAIPDSSFMIILNLIINKKIIKKLSGAKFLKLFLKEKFLKKENVLFLVDPSKHESELNRKYLNDIGIPIKKTNQYTAPQYKKNVEDYQLLESLNKLKYKPKYILINIGGGIQEKLGYFLKNNLSFECSIICTGAAIAFVTGAQTKIPKMIDMLFLGWLTRIISNPKVFIPRYIKAFRLIKVFIKYKKGLIK